jgi:hypothetical protein
MLLHILKAHILTTKEYSVATLKVQCLKNPVLEIKRKLGGRRVS